jgi:hypothetical protein
VIDEFEGDLIRPLGLVTLYFAYAEYELDLFLGQLSPIEPFDETKRQWQVGRKLALAEDLVRQLHDGGSTGLEEVFAEARALFERRNLLIHSCVLAGGRVVSSRPNTPEWRTTPKELTELAEQIFTCKERFHVYRWRVIEPLLSKRLARAEPSKSPEGARG